MIAILSWDNSDLPYAENIERFALERVIEIKCTTGVNVLIDEDQYERVGVVALENLNEAIDNGRFTGIIRRISKSMPVTIFTYRRESDTSWRDGEGNIIEQIVPKGLLNSPEGYDELINNWLRESTPKGERTSI